MVVSVFALVFVMSWERRDAVESTELAAAAGAAAAVVAAAEEDEEEEDEDWSVSATEDAVCE